MSRELTRSTGLFPTVVFDDFFKPWNEWFDNSNLIGRMLTVPAVNISENKDNYLVSLAVPGMKKDDFKIAVDGNMLTISAETKKEEVDKKYNRREYNYSSFSRTFTLPDEVNKEKIEATYENGALRLTLTKKEGAKKAAALKSIAIK